jgi:mannose PTS system EIID component
VSGTHSPRGLNRAVAAGVSIAVVAAVFVAGPVRGAGTGGPGVTLPQALLVALGYYLANSPWLAGNGGFLGLYRPLVGGFLVGIILGDPVKGAEIGAVINLLYIGFISAGGSIPSDPSLAGWVGTALAIGSGADARTAITIGAAVGLLGTVIFYTRMSVDSVFAHWADARAEAGDIRGVALMNWLPPQLFLFVVSVIPATVAVYAGSSVVGGWLAWLSANAPWVLNGFMIAGGMLPALGIAMNMRFIFRGSAIPYFFIGYILAVAGGVGQTGGALTILSVGVLGASLGFLHVSLISRRAGSTEEPVAAEGAVAEGTPDDRPRLQVTRGDVRRSFWLWTFFSHANYNYERLQGTAFAHAMTPIIRRLYSDPAEIKAALKRHLVFFNTEPNIGGIIHGAVIAMEEQRANGAEIDDDAINSVKSGLMGPLAGVGDSIDQGTITPILLTIGISLAGSGNILGPVLYFVLEMAIMLSIAYFMWMQGYERGREGVLAILRSGVLDRVISGAAVLGNTVLGALAAQFVSLHVSWHPVIGTDPTTGKPVTFPIQDTIDKLMPALLPLLFVMLTWWLLVRRHVSPVVLLAIYIGVAMLGAWNWFGLFNPATDCGSLLNAFSACNPH